LFAAGLARAASFDARVEALFRPPNGEHLALSPDGQRVAYTTRAGGDLAIMLLDVENPGRKRRIAVEAEPLPMGTAGGAPLQLRFLRWATPDRLIYALAERVVPLPAVIAQDGRTAPNPDGPMILAPIMAVDADGKQRGTVIDAKNFQETPAEARRSLADLLRTTEELQATHTEPVHWRMPHLDILGFYPRDREQLIVQTHGGYSIPTQHLVDVRTGGVREFGDEWTPPPGEPQVFDWFRMKVVGARQDGVRPSTRWTDDDLGRAQRALEAKFPRRIVELLDWSDTHARVLCRVTGGTDAGRVFIFQRPEDLVVEIFHRAPWLSAAKLHATRWFEFDAPDGARLSGYLTRPTKPRVNPPPLLVIFPRGPTGPAQPAWDPEAQVFAELGFAVARLNHRSVAGGRAVDEHVAIDDGRAVIAWLEAANQERAFDRERVATLGRGFGGYLAMRALQLQPKVFHSGIAVDLPPELRTKLDGQSEARIHPERAWETSEPPPESRAAGYRKMEEFFSARFQNYAVKIGAAKEVP
jgi:hypothetical protein